MADYKMKVKGLLPSDAIYSWSWNIRSNQTPGALVTTLSAGLTDMWSNGTYGVGSQYVPGTLIQDFEVITLDGHFNEVDKVTQVLSLVGTSGDAAISDKSTMVMRKLCSGIGRTKRGFTHLPAPVEGVLVDGLYTVTARNRFTTAMRALHSAITADGSTLFVHTGAETSKTGIAPYTVTVVYDVTCSNKPGTQRNRMNKVVGVYS